MATGVTTLNLEQIRKRAGITLAGIADSTKISSRFLHAIESEEFEKLPGGVFNTSYIRQYAAAIGYPEHDLLTLYYSRIPDPEQADRPAPAPVRSWSLRACFAWLLNYSPAHWV
jgi:cytoskeletal protein RodZ